MNQNTVQIRYALRDVSDAAAACWSKISGSKVLAITGQMGAGKTTFIRSLCLHLGVKDAVSSPTYSLVNEYHLPERASLYHMDLYRLKDAEEAIDAGIVDLFSSDAVCLIEWPELLHSYLPSDTIFIHIQILDDQSRLLEMKVPG
jgi:tRNA threonylcarbamoyladenosine biosynthesis protein TsaE